MIISPGALAQETGEPPEGVRVYLIERVPIKSVKDKAVDVLLLPVKAGKYCAAKTWAATKWTGRKIIKIEEKVRPAANVVGTMMTLGGAYVLVRKGFIQ